MKTHPNLSLLARALFISICALAAVVIATPVMAQGTATTPPTGTAVLPGGTAVLPEAYYNRTLEEMAAEDTSGMTVWEILNSSQGFEQLVLTIETAGFEDQLTQPGPITFFAPTNGAYYDLPDGTFENLIADGREPLYSILQYHMMLGEIEANELIQYGTALTVYGERLSVAVRKNGIITVDGKDIFQIDIEAANGIIHVLGTMLNPF